MRRLPEGRDALSLLGRGELSAEQIDAIARAVARFHDAHTLGRPAPFSPGDWMRTIADQVEGNLDSLARAFHDDRPAALAEAARRFLAAHRDRFEARRLDGRAVDGHGDLHLAHIWFERPDSAPLFIDCVEFNDEFRRLDAASDVAFLAMDLQYRHAPELADRFLRRYAAESGDFHLFAVIDYYLSYRAAVRAKVAALAVEEPELSDEQRHAAHRSATRHLDLAIDALNPAGRGGLVVVTGIVGTGKSSAAEVVADVVGGAAVITSDRVRKQLAGATGEDHLPAPFSRGLYREPHTRRVYAALLERADAVVASGRLAVLDATFAQPEQRAAAADFARTRQLPLLIVETRCQADTARRRLAARQVTGTDPSDAGPELYRELARRFTPVSASPDWVHVVVDTERPAWRDELAKRVLAWRLN
jgi:predicted kinase